jgi:restriction system protein
LPTEWERAQKAREREEKRLYLERRSNQVDDLNQQIDRTIRRLETALVWGITNSPDLEALRTPFSIDAFDPGDLATPKSAPEPNAFKVRPLGLRKLLRSAQERHAIEVAAAQRRYQQAVSEHDQMESKRRSDLAHAEHEYRVRMAEAARRNSAYSVALESGDPASIIDYFERVLKAAYFKDLLPGFRLAYVADSKQLVIERDFPPVSTIPDVKSNRFIKTKDQITQTARPAAQIKSLYAGLVAQLSLLTMHQLFAADVDGHIESLVFNGFLDTVDRSTGKHIRPCLVTVRTTRTAFEELDLAHVDPTLCLKHLGANISRSPTELLPVRPIIEFNMVDKRFISEKDVLSELDVRPNLMELSPGDFENLITNLFSKMGLETRQTLPSRDGGVDCVAYDTRPVLGGKVVIQAKRYKGTVGVSAVRDLFGTVHNEGASKGILVTTSGYGRASFEFANGKPLELLNGSELLYLLQEHAGISARIEPPDDWLDPVGWD